MSYIHLCPSLPNNRFKELNVSLSPLLLSKSSPEDIKETSRKFIYMTTKQRRPIDEKRSCLACGNNLNHRRTNVIFCNDSCRNIEWRRVNSEKHRAASFNWYHRTKAKKQLNINNNQDQTNRKAS